MKKKKKRNLTPVFVAVIFVALISVACVVANYIAKNTPSDKKADMYEYFGFSGELTQEGVLSTTKADEVAVVLNETRMEERGLIIDGELYFSVEFVKNFLNSKFYWDKNENLLLYTTPTDLIYTEVGSSDYYVGKSRKTVDYAIVRAEGSDVYVAADYVKMYSKVGYELEKEPNHIRITTLWGDKNTVSVTEATQVRKKEDIKSDILKELNVKDKLYVVKDGKKWMEVCTTDGIIGYVLKEELSGITKANEDMEFDEPEYTSISRDETINMVWHQVTTSRANKKLPDMIADMKGVNVISPTWIKLADNDGNIESIASYDYVNLAHKCDMEVWALVDNFKGDVKTKQILSYTSKRENLINQLIAEVLKYKIDGINIDFEMLSEEAGEDFIQFIRELSIKCRLNEIVLSVDNYNCVAEGGTDYYNRKAQGEVVDYVINMGYDEHTNSGGKSGSVASIDYVRRGIEGTLEEVPAEKVINAIPFYSRLWEETPKTEEELAAEDASDEYIPYHLDSEALGMNTMEGRCEDAGAEKKWDETTAQYYFEFTRDGKTYKAWMEEERSIEEKLKLMKKYKLAGVAAWKLGFERESIWDTIIKYTN